MLAGLPFESWLLLLVSIGLPLAIELKFYLTHRRPGRNEPENGS